MAYLEATLRAASAVALFLDRRFDDFCDERFSELTNFRMNTDSSGKGATFSFNHEFISTVYNFTRTANGL